MSSSDLKTPKTKREKEEEGDSPESNTTAESALTLESQIRVVVLGEGGELDLEEKLNQEGLPEEIKSKTYSTEADLLKDLDAFGAGDNDRYISLNSKGQAHLKMPTVFHAEALKSLKKHVERHGPRELALDLSSKITLVDGADKYPDLAIWGPERAEDNEAKMMSKGSQDPRVPMNPHVIIEFSWKNDLESDEKPKFRAQLSCHDELRGIIKVGFLIKTIGAKGVRALPNEKDDGETIADNPICGFDVYELRHGEDSNLSEPTLQYRVGEREDACIAITGNDLGNGELAGIQIPLSCIRDKLEFMRLKFAKQVKA